MPAKQTRMCLHIKPNWLIGWLLSLAFVKQASSLELTAFVYAPSVLQLELVDATSDTTSTQDE